MAYALVIPSVLAWSRSGALPVDRFIVASDGPPGAFIRDCLQRPVQNRRLHLKTVGDRRVPVLLSCSPLKGNHGEMIGMVLVARDTTFMTEAQKALEAGEKRYRELVENIGDVIYTIHGWSCSRNAEGVAWGWSRSRVPV